MVLGMQRIQFYLQLDLLAVYVCNLTLNIRQTVCYASALLQHFWLVNVLAVFEIVALWPKKKIT